MGMDGFVARALYANAGLYREGTTVYDDGKAGMGMVDDAVHASVKVSRKRHSIPVSGKGNDNSHYYHRYQGDGGHCYDSVSSALFLDLVEDCFLSGRSRMLQAPDSYSWLRQILRYTRGTVRTGRAGVPESGQKVTG